MLLDNLNILEHIFLTLGYGKSIKKYFKHTKGNFISGDSNSRKTTRDFYIYTASILTSGSDFQA